MRCRALWSSNRSVHCLSEFGPKSEKRGRRANFDAKPDLRTKLKNIDRAKKYEMIALAMISVSKYEFPTFEFVRVAEVV